MSPERDTREHENAGTAPQRAVGEKRGQPAISNNRKWWQSPFFEKLTFRRLCLAECAAWAKSGDSQLFPTTGNGGSPRFSQGSRPSREGHREYTGSVHKAIIFDLGKTIIPFEIDRGYAALAPHCGLKREEMRRRLQEATIVQRFEAGEVSPERFVEEFSAALGLKLDYGRFCELWSSIFLPEPLVPEELLEGLAKRYRMLLLSNTNAIHFAMVRVRYPILRHFDDFVLSYEVGALKPAEKIYRAAVERAGCAPEECFFTDDIDSYVEGARAVGLDAVQFESAEQIERELAGRGIKWA